MIKPAKDYELKIAIESIWTKDNPENEFLYLDNHALRLFNDETKAHEFAIVDNNNDLIGFIRYGVKNNKAYNLEIINFNRKSQGLFARDLLRICKDVFEKYNLDSLSFSGNKNHPLIQKYKKILEGFGGTFKDHDEYLFFTLTKKQYNANK